MPAVICSPGPRPPSASTVALLAQVACSISNVPLGLLKPAAQPISELPRTLPALPQLAPPNLDYDMSPRT